MNEKRKYKSSLAKRNLKKFMSNKIALIGFIVMAVVVLLCLCAPLLTTYDPIYSNLDERLLPFSLQHPLGTDQNGRDNFARLLYGGQYSIMIGLVAALGSNLLGVILGCLAGYYGGKIDSVLMNLYEIMSCFPQIVLIMIVIAYLGQSVFFMILTFVITGWMGSMRIVRLRIIALKEEPFVESLIANGIKGWSIMFRHLLPNTFGFVMVGLTAAVSSYVLAEAGLSFLGLGVPQGIPTWGNMINAAKDITIMQISPVLWIAPGVAISLFVLSVFYFGDGLRDVFDATQN